ncbi:complement C2-like isoform X1 [Dreissena polymorpha]|uniref:complement C2-like isoform X1 n=1 Tax=Dreissena polymorpha TaxID=45954 RepID=UPI0022648948|nr:complement C2-like isoform X1 [Dreissena polymorpha]
MHCEIYVVGVILGWTLHCSGESQLTVGEKGLDVIILMDTSASIDPVSLELAKQFTKIIVKNFGVSARADGGNETRFALITFDQDAKLVFNLNDATVRSVDAVIKKINEIKTSGGGKSLISAIDKAVNDIYFPFIFKDVTRGGPDTNRAVFILTDTANDNVHSTLRLHLRIKALKEHGKFKIFALGVGRNIDRQTLWDIASEPPHEHMFVIDVFKDLQKIGDSIAGKYLAQSSVGERGLDVIIIMDTSATIGIVSLELAKHFMKIIVKNFEVSASADGGNGTRFALITFDQDAKLVFNLNDASVRSIDAVIKKINEIKTKDGGKSLTMAIDRAFSEIYMRLIHMNAARGGLDRNRTVFILTDAAIDTDHYRTAMLKRRINMLKEHGKFKIFAIGVGRNIDRQTLWEIASEPPHEHVFVIDDFKDLRRIGDTIAGKNIDFGECGKPGKVNVHQDTGDAVKGAWPWVGWIGARGKLCGGALLCDKFFITAARCVSEVNETTNEMVPYPTREISVSLGIIKLFDQDIEQQMTSPVNVIFHPNYTGIPEKYGVRYNDVAILDLGEINKTRPTLNSFIKPICFPYRKYEYFK